MTDGFENPVTRFVNGIEELDWGKLLLLVPGLRNFLNSFDEGLPKKVSKYVDGEVKTLEKFTIQDYLDNCSHNWLCDSRPKYLPEESCGIDVRQWYARKLRNPASVMHIFFRNYFPKPTYVSDFSKEGEGFTNKRRTYEPIDLLYLNVFLKVLKKRFLYKDDQGKLNIF